MCEEYLAYSFLFNLLFLITFFIDLRGRLVRDFKIGYYEQKLKNRSIDISHIENISYREVFKLK